MATKQTDFDTLDAHSQKIIADTRLQQPGMSTAEAWDLLTRLKTESEIEDPERGGFWCLAVNGTLSFGRRS